MFRPNNWRYLNWLWIAVSCVVLLIGLAGIPDNIAVWMGWLEALGDWEIPKVNPWISGISIGFGLSGLLVFFGVRWKSPIVAGRHAAVVKFRWTRIHLRDTYRECESVIFGVPVAYEFFDKTNNIRYLPRNIRVRAGRSAVIWLPRKNYAEREVEMTLDIRGHGYTMTATVIDLRGHEHPVTGLFRSFSRHFGSQYRITLKQYRLPDKVRIQVERLLG